MIPRPHQIEMAEKAVYLLRSYNIAYFAAEERTGKSLAALLTAEKMVEIDKVIIITKKAALKGWQETIAAYPLVKNIILTNYHQMNKLEKTEFNTLVIFDESHSYLSAYPKRSAMWKLAKKVAWKMKILYISATPYAQGPQQLYNQLALSSWSPWYQYDSFYAWFKSYGFPYTIKLQGRECPQYDKADKEKILGTCQHLFITKTRSQLGFEYEPTDQLHYINLNPITKEVYNDLLQDRIVELNAGMLVCDTIAKLRSALHMLEGGVAKIKDDYHVLANEEKVAYILANFGDSKDLVIMYNYIAEQTKLARFFKKATLLQATSYAEGVDLSMFKHLVIYSMNFSTAKYTQRRARQANMERKEEIKVHYLLVKKAISDQVYKTVAINKRNFVDSVFERSKL